MIESFKDGKRDGLEMRWYENGQKQSEQNWKVGTRDGPSNHWFKSGPKAYVGDYQTLYYFILISHILLAAIIIPLALFTLYRGWNYQIEKHRKIARITLPIWLYVSVTGVIIYTMLY